jgi:hypothetical protein
MPQCPIVRVSASATWPLAHRGHVAVRRLVRGSLDGRMEKLDTIFTDLVQPADIAA